MRTALLQMTSGDDPVANLAYMKHAITEAADQGAGFVLTPELCNCISLSRRHQNDVLRHEDDDVTLAGLRDLSAKLGIWLLLGSLGLKTNDPEGRFANRSFVIDPNGDILGKYDKIHMFDVEISETESFRESVGYRPGKQLQVVDTPFGKLGLSVCYDLRFPHIFRAMAKTGAEIFPVPSAFSPVTGAAHWEPLLRARAIENGVYVLAPAQTGQHLSKSGQSRSTYGHSLAVDPWGKILAKLDQKPDTLFIEINRENAGKARRQIPSLLHDRQFEGPK